MDRGIFITFEGPDGSGKSTQINILKEKFIADGRNVLLSREPGGTKISEKIRDILLDKDNMEMSAETEALLYAASRAQHVNQVIKPALKAGKIVILDRYLHSSLAYQAYGRELGEKTIMDINAPAVNNTMPDISFFILLSAEKSKERLKNSGQELDRLEVEKLAFFKRVSNAYYDIGKTMDNIVIIDASLSIKDIADIIDEHIKKLMKQR